MLITGDMNFPNILWDSSSRARAANEVAFVDALNDHYLTQVNGVTTRDGNVLDLIITSVPDQVTVTEVLSSEKSGVFTDHCVLSFEYSAFVKSPNKINRTVYDYENGDFEGLRVALDAINLSLTLGSDDINTDWQN